MLLFCLIVIFYFLLAMFIYWNSSIRKNCPFLNPICVLSYVSMDLWPLILWVKIQYYHYAFYYSSCSNFGNQEELLQVTLVSFQRALKPFRASPLFPAPQNVSGSSYIFPAHALDSRASLPAKKSWFLLLEESVLKQELGAQRYWGFTIRPTIWATTTNICFHTKLISWKSLTSPGNLLETLNS